MEGLKDIKPIVEVPDVSLWVLIGIAVALMVALVVALYFAWRYLNTPKNPLRDEAIRRLDLLDFRDTKQVVYEFTLLSHYAVTPELSKEHRALLAELERYKYQKNVQMLDRDLRQRMRNFIREVHRG